MSLSDTYSNSNGKIPFLEITKTIFTALFIALLGYWIPVFAEQLLPPAELGMNYVSFDNKKGNLLSIRNYSDKAIEQLVVYVYADLSSTNVSVDGALSLEVVKKDGLTAIKLGQIPPRRESYLFMKSEIPFRLNEIKITSTSYMRSTQNLLNLQRTFWDFGTFLNSIFVFTIYMFAMLFSLAAVVHGDSSTNI